LAHVTRRECGLVGRGDRSTDDLGSPGRLANSYESGRVVAFPGWSGEVVEPDPTEHAVAPVEADFDEGYDVDFVTSRALAVEDGRVPMRVSVYCPARDGSLPVLVEVEPVRSAVGGKRLGHRQRLDHTSRRVD
jgi:hypothetical protein